MFSPAGSSRNGFVGAAGARAATGKPVIVRPTDSPCEWFRPEILGRSRPNSCSEEYSSHISSLASRRIRGSGTAPVLPRPLDYRPDLAPDRGPADRGGVDRPVRHSRHGPGGEPLAAAPSAGLRGTLGAGGRGCRAAKAGRLASAPRPLGPPAPRPPGPSCPSRHRARTPCWGRAMLCENPAFGPRSSPASADRRQVGSKI